MSLDWLVDSTVPSGFDPPLIETWPDGVGSGYRPGEALGQGLKPVVSDDPSVILKAWRSRQALGALYWAIVFRGRVVKAVHMPDCCRCQRCHPENHGPAKCLCHWPLPRVHAPGRCFCSWHATGGYPLVG